MKIRKIALLAIEIFSIVVVISGEFKYDNSANINSEEKIVSVNKTDDLNDEKEAASDLSNKAVEYEIISKTYNKGNIKINYPQIKSYGDTEKTNSINKVLEEEALSILNIYIQEGTNIKDITLEINYEVKLKNPELISIVYDGYINIKGTAYPTSLFYTTNINLERSSSIGLSDYANIKDILKKLRDLNNVKLLSEGKELQEAQKSILASMSDDELLSMLKDADFHKVNDKILAPENGAYSYMDGDNIVISIPMIHAIGDHAEFEVGK